VDSIPARVTRCSASQSASAVIPAVVVAKVRVCWTRRRRPDPGTRTVATTVSRCTSNPAQRRTNTSISALLPDRALRQGRRPGEGLSVKSLRFALAAAGQGASGLHAILLCELTAPSVTGVEPEATAWRFSSGRVGRGHSYFYVCQAGGFGAFVVIMVAVRAR
jgi:hypothetical protein